MDTTTTETTTVETPAAVTAAAPVKAKPQRKIATPASKAPAKKAVKPRPVKAEAPVREKAEPPTNAHVTAGVDVSTYTGLSKFVNQNRRTKVMTGVTRSTGSLTDRMQKGLYALRKTYGGKSWPAKGFDNGILSELAGAGLITLDGGIVENIDGHAYRIDAATPVVGKLTSAGMKYGIA